jgi:hypothetical protein
MIFRGASFAAAFVAGATTFVAGATAFVAGATTFVAVATTTGTSPDFLITFLLIVLTLMGGAREVAFVATCASRVPSVFAAMTFVHDSSMYKLTAVDGAGAVAGAVAGAGF